ncbi:MAG: hypothetical protein ABIK92_12550 [Pseudomonadota bacterium]
MEDILLYQKLLEVCLRHGAELTSFDAKTKKIGIKCKFECIENINKEISEILDEA